MGATVRGRCRGSRAGRRGRPREARNSKMPEQPHPFVQPEAVRIGPIKSIEIKTWSPPAEGETIVACLSHAQVPFETIRHLVSDKPLRRRG